MSSIRFDIITIFPKVFEDYFNESILERAQKKRLVKIKIWDLRKFLRGKERVDDRPYGGGPGMVLKIEPLANCVRKLLGKASKSKTLVILLSASGKQFDSKMAGDFVKKYHRVIFIAGHYEGVDERMKSVIKNLKLEVKSLSIGPYVLTGGELPAMVMIDAITRHIPGVLGKTESLEEKRYGVGVPAYTRPEVFKFGSKKYRVPPVLLSGNHAKIDKWRKTTCIANRYGVYSSYCL